jgi:N-acetylmuramate 1-kinase
MQINTSPIVWHDPQRQVAFEAWFTPLCHTHHLDPQTLCLASADASFRRYLRVYPQAQKNTSLIIMDAPPDLENSEPFVKICQMMEKAHLLVPHILDWDSQNGFLLLSDLGQETMMQALCSATGEWGQLSPIPHAFANTLEPNEKTLVLFKKAIAELITWQLSSLPQVLPAYDEALLQRELALFHDWYLIQNKGLVASALEQQWPALLNTVFSQIVQHNLSTPQVFVHRDFMPRNLMIPWDPQEERLGVLDFQDAVHGPITYDIASLMRDAFVSWPEEFVLDVTVRYWEQAKTKGLLDQEGLWNDFGAFYREVEWMGLQRHLKVAGIFSRLTLRDQKAHYLLDTPRFIHYIRSTCLRYRELGPFLKFIDHVEGHPSPEGYAFGRI